MIWINEKQKKKQKNPINKIKDIEKEGMKKDYVYENKARHQKTLS